MNNKQIILKNRPQGTPDEHTWKLEVQSVPELQEGEILIEHHYLSLDPAMRGWMNDTKSYIPPVEINGVMRAGSVGKVIQNNNNPNFLTDPKSNFGGIMRAINSTNFEQANVEYIQFWAMDPYFGNPGDVADPTNTGKLVFNLGEISEDVLRDGRKLYENGLPIPGSTQPSVPSIWGKVPASQSLIYAFDNDPTNRTIQDIGYDGLNDTDESALFPAFAAQPDPAADNYQYFLQAGGNDIVNRYANYNNVQGNSPTDVSDTNRGSTTVPDVEDINRDNTMNTINAYYEYRININPSSLATVGQNFVTDIKLTDVTLPNGAQAKARWVQFKIPINQYFNTVGSITDFRSIRFMRMFMTGFNDRITTRFGALDLVRGEWRRYEVSLQYPLPQDDPSDDGTNFEVQVVNIQENEARTPINYIPPPGVQSCLLYTSPSPRDRQKSRMPSSA